MSVDSYDLTPLKGGLAEKSPPPGAIVPNGTVSLALRMYPCYRISLCVNDAETDILPDLV